MKRLLKAVKEKPDGRYIKIGSKNGSAFWFIGTKDEFLKKIKDLNAQYRKKFKEDAENLQKKVDDLLTVKPTVISFVKLEEKKENPDYSVQNYWDYVGGCFASTQK